MQFNGADFPVFRRVPHRSLRGRIRALVGGDRVRELPNFQMGELMCSNFFLRS